MPTPIPLTMLLGGWLSRFSRKREGFPFVAGGDGYVSSVMMREG
jgi:hypothetical protein